MERLIGERQQELLKWLCGDWVTAGPNVCILEGFSGVGKTTVARETIVRLDSLHRPAVLVDMPESGADQVDDLLLDLGMELAKKGYKELAEAVDRGEDLVQALEQVLLKPVVIVIDEVQRTLESNSAVPVPRVLSFLNRVGRRVQPGRLLLLSNRAIDRGKWVEAHEIRALPGLTIAEARALLNAHLGGVNK